jgi:hypothetical protein
MQEAHDASKSAAVKVQVFQTFSHIWLGLEQRCGGALVLGVVRWRRVMTWLV